MEKHFSKRGMMLKSAEVLSCTCDDRQTLQITYSVEEDTFGWKVSTRPTDEVNSVTIEITTYYVTLSLNITNMFTKNAYCSCPP